MRSLVHQPWMVCIWSIYGCTTDADCQAFENPTCGDLMSNLCDSPLDNSYCDYLGAGTGYMVDFSGVALCSRTCSSHSDCSSLPTAKICWLDNTPKYCVECLNTENCTAMGFKNHDCYLGFCKYPLGDTHCHANTNYCGSTTVECFDDTIRCWFPCSSNGDCGGSATCVPGVTFTGGGVWSALTNLPPSASPSAGCSTDNDCPTVKAAYCDNGSCTACNDDSHCTHLSSTPYCDESTCRACEPNSHSGCSDPTAAKCDTSNQQTLRKKSE